MKKLVTLVIVYSAFFLSNAANCQSLSPNVQATAGGYSTGGGKSLSWTVGETFYTTLQSSNNILTQGEQQPYILLKILNLKAYIQGFYTSSGQMQAPLYNKDPMLPSNYCDSITVELHHATSPYTLVATRNTLLLTDGTALVKFPATLVNGSYYIAIRGRNVVETWSKNTVLFNSANVNFDFSKY